MGRFIPLAVLLMAAALLGLSTHEALEPVQQHDKLSHVVGGLLIVLSVAHAFPRWSLVKVALLCTSAAIALEGMQSLVPDRTASWGDIVAGFVGIAVGVVALRALAAHRAARRLTA